jgi:hypothetical protein
MTQLSGTLDNGIQPAPTHPAADRDDVSGPPGFHLEALLSPGRMFSHPAEVVGHPGLTRDEKRAILASWASDACAVEAAPALRRLPGASEPVRVDDVLTALRALDPDRPNDADHPLRSCSRVLWRNPKLTPRVSSFGRRTGIQVPRSSL